MENFIFNNPTKIIFGKDTENDIGNELAKYAKKVLFHYGSGSIVTSGLYERVVKSLNNAGIEFIELAGVKPNPRLSLVRDGIRLCRENNIDFILAVGGGSVIDSAKAIAAGVLYKGDVWDFFSGKADIVAALPVATILTIPAAGSEASSSSVITNEDGWLKRGMGSDLLRPLFSIMNPVLTYTLPDYQTACGAADIMAHVMERYFTNTSAVDYSDRLCEATLKSMIKNVPLAISDPSNYSYRAEIMWAGTVAHNDLLGRGRTEDWASHDIEHELSAIYDIAHGAGLAVVFPAWMKYVYKHDVLRFVQFAVRVWDVEMDFENPELTALEGISRLENFNASIGLPVTLPQLSIPSDKLDEMADKCTGSDGYKLGNFVKLGRADVRAIYELAL